MDDFEFERRLLEFVYETDAVITAGAVAYFARCPIRDAEEGLGRLVDRGVLILDSDDDGELFYVYPHRRKLARPRSPGALPPPVMVVGGAAKAADPALAALPPAPEVAGTDDGDKRCPFCGETILAVAKKCKHCGEMLDPELREAARPAINVGIQQLPARYVPEKCSPGVAAVLSLLWPGAGHMYSGRIGAGLGWMFAVVLGYVALFVPGVILHVASIFSAAGTARDENQRALAP